MPIHWTARMDQRTAELTYTYPTPIELLNLLSTINSDWARDRVIAQIGKLLGGQQVDGWRVGRVVRRVCKDSPAIGLAEKIIILTVPDGEIRKEAMKQLVPWWRRLAAAVQDRSAGPTPPPYWG